MTDNSLDSDSIDVVQLPDKRKTSMGKFCYALRPAKNIERKMLCETFAALACISPMSKYRYIGFGSVEFVDFKLFHQRLGITDMISIEGEDDINKQKRVKYNLPYSCITMKWGNSSEILPLLGWKKKTIIWLDYDYPLNAQILDDIRLVSSSLVSGSVLVVTVDAKPKSFEVQGEDIHQLRYAELENNVGKKKMHDSIKGKDLANWGLASASKKIIDNEIAESLRDRNGPLSTSSRLRYTPLFNFHYADGAQMLTIGGIFLNSNDNKKMDDDIFKNLEFIRTDDKKYLIETPILTLREIRYLDKYLPGKKTLRDNWIPEAEKEKYKKVYRYFPNYSEVEA